VLNTTSSFNSWRADHCFSYAGDSSFMLTKNLTVAYYDDTVCGASSLVDETKLSADCGAVDNVVESGATRGTGVTVQYTLSQGKYTRAISLRCLLLTHTHHLLLSVIS
jgi:hypothetical protein